MLPRLSMPFINLVAPTIEQPSDIAPLLQPLDDFLQQHPEGVDELTLIRHLQQQQLLPQQSLSDQYSLFQIHFLLFHALYLLRNRLRSAQQGEITIHALKIQRLDYQPQSPGLISPDPLADYYLDLSQLQQTGREDVIAMLTQFWHQLGTSPQQRDTDYQQALATLNADETMSLSDIKRHYRKQVMQHHPDRGGETTALQHLNHAMKIVNRYHR